jgi:hypothetical protein
LSSIESAVAEPGNHSDDNAIVSASTIGRRRRRLGNTS